MFFLKNFPNSHTDELPFTMVWLSSSSIYDGMETTILKVLKWTYVVHDDTIYMRIWQVIHDDKF